MIAAIDAPPLQAKEWYAFARQAVDTDTSQSRIEAALHFAVRERLKAIIKARRRSASSSPSSPQGTHKNTLSPLDFSPIRRHDKWQLQTVSERDLSSPDKVQGAILEAGEQVHKSVSQDRKWYNMLNLSSIATRVFTLLPMCSRLGL